MPERDVTGSEFLGLQGELDVGTGCLSILSIYLAGCGRGIWVLLEEFNDVWAWSYLTWLNLHHSNVNNVQLCEQVLTGARVVVVNEQESHFQNRDGIVLAPLLLLQRVK